MTCHRFLWSPCVYNQRGSPVGLWCKSNLIYCVNPIFELFILLCVYVTIALALMLAALGLCLLFFTLVLFCMNLMENISVAGFPACFFDWLSQYLLHCALFCIPALVLCAQTYPQKWLDPWEGLKNGPSTHLPHSHQHLFPSLLIYLQLLKWGGEN